jgi:ERCC4-type nuclease
MKKPNFNYPSLKFDPSLIIQNTGTLDGLTNKREFLKNLLKSGPLWNMINSVDKYGVNGIIKYSQINAFASTQLYSTFKLLIGFYIVYYQEMAMIDQSTPGEGNIKYNNPWMSSYIGDPGKIGKKQPLGSLLGDLQDLCQKLFDYLKYTYLQYWRSLSWTDHSDCCDWYCPGSCVRWSRMEDKSNCYDQNWWDLINEKHPNTNNGPKWSAYMDNLYKTEENKTGTYNWFIYIFDDYMNFPFTQLQVLKKMAGIDYLIGEQNFDYQDYCRNQTYDTNKITIYSAMFSLNYYKGFSVMRTFTIEETAIFICNTANKLQKTDKLPFYNYNNNNITSITKPREKVGGEIVQENTSENSETHIIIEDEVEVESIDNNESTEKNESSEKDYVSVIKKVKKDNITVNNIGEIILCQIPGISSVTALAIMDKFKTIPNLIKEVDANVDCLQNISYTNAKGQTRKITKTSIANIVTFLLQK